MSSALDKLPIAIMPAGIMDIILRTDASLWRHGLFTLGMSLANVSSRSFSTEATKNFTHGSELLKSSDCVYWRTRAHGSAHKTVEGGLEPINNTSQRRPDTKGPTFGDYSGEVK